MADIKISQLGAAIAVGDTDLMPIVSGGNTLKATAAQVKEHSIGNTNISSIGNGSVTGAINALNTDKQPKILDTPLTIGGVSKTTVENALSGLVSENQTLTNDEQKTRDSIAPTENGTYYANSYSKGAQFYHNGVLREVTASSVNTSSAISSTSVTVDSITSQMNDAKKVILSASDMTLPAEITLYGTNANFYHRVGKIVNLHISLKIVSSTKKALEIANFVKISKDMPVNGTGGCLTDGESDGLMQYVAISDYGVLNLWNTKTGVSYAQGVISYIAKG